MLVIWRLGRKLYVLGVVVVLTDLCFVVLLRGFRYGTWDLESHEFCNGAEMQLNKQHAEVVSEYGRLLSVFQQWKIGRCPFGGKEDMAGAFNAKCIHPPRRT